MEESGLGGVILPRVKAANFLNALTSDGWEESPKLKYMLYKLDVFKRHYTTDVSGEPESEVYAYLQILLYCYFLQGCAASYSSSHCIQVLLSKDRQR